MAETFLARLKPYNPTRGYLVRRYWCRGVIYDESRGWYRVTKEDADVLRDLVQKETDPGSPALFDVCTEDEAKDLERREKLAERQRRTVEEASRIQDAHTGAVEPSFDLTSDDLPKPDMPPPPDLPESKPAPRPATGRDRRRGR